MRQVLRIAPSLLAAVVAAGCVATPSSFVERIDGIELSFVERYIAIEWMHVFWNEDGTIDEIDFLGREIRDEDLAEVARHPKLRILKLGDTEISDAGLAHLQGATGLVMLGLRGTKVTDAGLAHLGNMKKLRSLLLARTAVTDVGLHWLQPLEGLEELGLSETAVTDAGLRLLGGLPKLGLLHVRGCAGVTPEGLDALRATHPDITIVSDETRTGPSEGNLVLDPGARREVDSTEDPE